MEHEKYKNRYLKYKKKYLKLKNIYGGLNIKAKEFLPKNKKTGEKKVKMIEKRELEILTHNLGGQTYYINKNDKSYLSYERGEIVQDKTKNKYKTIEELNKNIPPPELNEKTDIYLFQEWQTQEKSGPRINDLVIQTKWGKSINGTNRYLDYTGIYLIDTMKEKSEETIIIKNVHLPIVSETSSLTQIEKLIQILKKIIEEIKEGKKIILGGDFNIDFNNIDYKNIKKMLDGSKKKDVSKNADRLIEDLKKLYSEFNLKNLIIYPIKKNKIRTNIWSLPIEGDLTEKCVDYIMVSKTLEEYIDIKNSKFEIDESYVGGSLGEPIEFLKNDYDHIRLKLKIVLNDRYRIGYINE